MSAERVPPVRIQVDYIGAIEVKRQQYADLFGLPVHRVVASIKGPVTASDDGEEFDVKTFRVVEQLGSIGGVKNQRAKIKVDGRPTWVRDGGQLDLLLSEA